MPSKTFLFYAGAASVALGAVLDQHLIPAPYSAYVAALSLFVAAIVRSAPQK